MVVPGLVPDVCGGLGSQDNSESKSSGEKLIPVQRRESGPRRGMRARGPLPVPAAGPEPRPLPSLFLSQTAVGARPGNLSELLTSWRGVSWR